MERGLEQLFLPALILLLALGDLFLRWVRRKLRQDEAGDVTAGEAGPAALENDEGNADVAEPVPAEPQRLPAPLPISASRSLPSSLPPPTISPRGPRSQYRRRGLMHPRDARRGIILMMILGPCRGLAPGQSTPSTRYD